MKRRTLIAAVVIGGAAAMTVAGLVLAATLAAGGGGLGFGPSVGIVEVDGIIFDESDVVEQIRRYRRDATVRGLVVVINSPGGAVAPSQSVYRELRRFRDEEERPVVASISTVGASGGYYVALAADSIYALPGSITGSIGVMMEFPDVSGLMEKLGLRMDVVKSSELKDIGSLFRPVSAEEREVLGALVDDVYDQFVDVVAEERRLPRETVLTLADGRILSGRQAHQAGLIDGLGSLSEAVSVAGEMAGLGDEPRVVRPKEDEFRLLDLVAGSAGDRTMAEQAKALLGELWMPRFRFVVPR